MAQHETGWSLLHSLNADKHTKIIIKSRNGNVCSFQEWMRCGVWGFFSLHKLDFLQMKLNKIAIYCGVLLRATLTSVVRQFQNIFREHMKGGHDLECKLNRCSGFSDLCNEKAFNDRVLWSGGWALKWAFGNLRFVDRSRKRRIFMLEPGIRLIKLSWSKMVSLFDRFLFKLENKISIFPRIRIHFHDFSYKVFLWKLSLS